MAISEPVDQAAPAAQAPASQVPAAQAPVAQAPAAPAAGEKAGLSSERATKKALMSPAVRNLIRRHSLDVNAIHGSGKVGPVYYVSLTSSHPGTTCLAPPGLFNSAACLVIARRRAPSATSCLRLSSCDGTAPCPDGRR